MLDAGGQTRQCSELLLTGTATDPSVAGRGHDEGSAAGRSSRSGGECSTKHGRNAGEDKVAVGNTTARSTAFAAAYE